MHTTYSVHAGILKPWRGHLPWLPAVFSFYHVLSPPLSGLNWRHVFPPWGSDPPFPKMVPPFTGSAHPPLPGSGTIIIVDKTIYKINFPIFWTIFPKIDFCVKRFKNIRSERWIFFFLNEVVLGIKNQEFYATRHSNTPDWQNASKKLKRKTKEWKTRFLPLKIVFTLPFMSWHLSSQ